MPAGEVTTTTVGVSRTGLSLQLSPQPANDEAVKLVIVLPSGQQVSGRGRCRAQMPGAVVGLSLELDGKNQATWDSFVDEEESTGSLWRMIGRIANAPDDAFAPRGLSEQSARGKTRFHTVGENGLAYRLAFSRCETDPGDESDLCVRLPGFREPARRLVRRVLREDMVFRMDDAATTKPVRARVVELNRGGWAYVQGDDHTPVGLVSLGVGELLLVEEGGASVFPHFTALELEQIACDTFRHDLARPAFARASSSAPPPVTLPALTSSPAAARPDPRRFQHGYDAVRFAQAAATDVQVRKYGERDIFFHPSVWAKVDDDSGMLMGPTMQDGVQLCVLALVGPGTPRVVRLTEASKVSLLKPPR